jgi:hypothetical protein
MECVKTTENGGFPRTILADQEGQGTDVELLPAGKTTDVLNYQFLDIHLLTSPVSGCRM